MEGVFSRSKSNRRYEGALRYPVGKRGLTYCVSWFKKRKPINTKPKQDKFPSPFRSRRSTLSQREKSKKRFKKRKKKRKTFSGHRELQPKVKLSASKKYGSLSSNANKLGKTVQ